MSKQTTVFNDNLETLPLKIFTEKAYLDYSMYVILDRALPHIADGLKPVQRRIVYAMSELGLKHTAKYKKSARTIGDVLGKFHPHGDSACYEAMVLMSQDFTYRYPLVDGQGNWGSPDDPKSFAAMRYTEARLSPYAEVLLNELDQGTVKWVSNFDGTIDEPQLLPARLPNILLNPTMGIAVGMSTDIPPHNLREVGAACIELLDNPNATVEKLCEHIIGPDYPTNAEIITPRHELLQMYKTGNGSIRQRAIYSREDGNIVITALPHQVSGAKVLEQIAAQMQQKKLPMIDDLRDESDHEHPTRLIIVPKSNRVDLSATMDHLFATTDLERSYRANFNMIGLDGRPKVKNLRNILSEWIEYRFQTVELRLNYRLNKVVDRLHILAGLLIAYLNLDEVIHIIRTEDEPKQKLIKRFALSEIQAEAILDTKLRHLAKLEEMKIRGEQDELEAEKAEIESLLNSKAKLTKLVKNEIQEDVKKYGDNRKSPLVERAQAQVIKETDLMPAEAITIVLSEKGWVRAAKGHEIDVVNLSYKAGDQFLAAAYGKSNESAVFLDSSGRTYSVATHTLPSARGQGEPLTGRLSPPAGATFVSVAMGSNDDHYLLVSDAGYGFVCKLEDLHCKNRNGKAVIKAPEGSLILPMKKVEQPESQYLATVTLEGRLLLFPISDLPQLSRGKGNKIIGIPSAQVKSRSDYVIDTAVLSLKQTLVLICGKRTLSLRMQDLTNYQGERGNRGNKLPRGYQKIDGLMVEDQ